MAIAKIILNGVVQMDVTGDTVASGNLLSGYTATGADGEQVTGSYVPSGGSGNWMGKNPYKIKTVANAKVYFEDTGFATWTPSTTASTIVSSADIETYTPDFTTYDYMLCYKWHTHFEYAPGTIEKIIITDSYFFAPMNLYAYRNTLAAMTTGEVSTATYNAGKSDARMFYKNSAGNNAFASGTYGVYPSMPSNTANLSSITIKSPTVYARCSSTYLSTARAADIDQSASFYELVIELWRVDAMSSFFGASDDIIRDMWLNGI